MALPAEADALQGDKVHVAADFDELNDGISLIFQLLNRCKLMSIDVMMSIIHDHPSNYRGRKCHHGFTCQVGGLARQFRASSDKNQGTIRGNAWFTWDILGLSDRIVD